jgi:hypothetical protein
MTTSLYNKQMHCTPHPCIDCGKLIRKKGGRCVACYKVSRRLTMIQNNTPYCRHYKIYLCKNGCGNKVKERGAICPKCHDKIALEHGEKRQAENDKRQKDWLDKQAKLSQAVKIETCLKSPTKRHYEIIDNATNTGVCKYCGREKNYKKLQEDYFEEIAKRGH